MGLGQHAARLVELAADSIFAPDRAAMGNGVPAVCALAGKTLAQAVRRLADKGGDALVGEHFLPVDDVQFIGINDQGVGRFFPGQRVGSVCNARSAHQPRKKQGFYCLQNPFLQSHRDPVPENATSAFG